MRSIELFVFGTSVLWGQGNNERDKIDVKIQEWLHQKYGASIKRIRHAHSGAVLLGASGPGRGPLNGEAPDPWPSVASQIAKAPSARQKVKLILLDGGINDVEISNILNPLLHKSQLDILIRKYCYQHMKQVLKALSVKYDGSKVYVLGYFQFLADRVSRTLCLKLLGKLGINVDDHNRHDLVSRVVANSKYFKNRSDVHLGRAVREAKKEFGLDCIFIESGFKVSDGVFGRPSKLYGIGIDPQFDERLFDYCPNALKKGRSGGHCFVAAIGHPNRSGIRQYVKQLKLAITEDLGAV